MIFPYGKVRKKSGRFFGEMNMKMESLMICDWNLNILY